MPTEDVIIAFPGLDMVRALNDGASDGEYVVTRNSRSEAPGDTGKKNHAATGASAAGIRALSTQFMAFYFRAPIKAFFRMRVDYMAIARAAAPRAQANEAWSWKFSTPGLLTNAVRQYGWRFIPDQILPPMIANVTVGAVLYTSYLQCLAAFHEPSARAAKRTFPPPPTSATFSAGLAAGAIQSLIAAPLDALQVRFNTRDMLENRYRTMWQYARLKLQEIGPRGVFAGYSLNLVRDSLGSAFFFTTFETIKSQAFYSFVTKYYGTFRPIFTDHQLHSGPQGQRSRPIIRPHYMLEPTAILLAGIAASIAQQLIHYPLTIIQNVHFQRLESLDYAAKIEQPRARMLQHYYKAYETTYSQCRMQAKKSGGWRRRLYAGLIMSTLRQVPSTSAGLIIFEIVRRKYATDDDIVLIRKDGYDILLP